MKATRALTSLSLASALASLAACGGAPAAAPARPTPPIAMSTPCPVATNATVAAGRVRFHVTFAGGVPDTAVAGRLLIAMTSLSGAASPFELGFDHLHDLWVAAEDMPSVALGAAVEIDPDLLAFPKAFSQAPGGKYRIAARLARGETPGLVGPIVEQTIDPSQAGTIELRLDKAEDRPPPPADTDSAKVVHFESKLLSAFYGRPITMDALVVLPPSYGTDKARRYATEYYVPGFGGDLTRVAQRSGNEAKKRSDAHYPEMVRVELPGMIPTGHHVFADSLNDGPWGSALVTELIPQLEKQFALIAAPRARLLGGHSSGGWSSLWLQITHPDFFGGTWSTAPDPVDLRNFTTVDVTPGSTDNFFHKKDGSPRMLMRMGGQDIYSMEEFARFEAVDGKVGALGTFNWVFSPRGPVGVPMPLASLATGEQDPAVQKAWEKWDIHKVLDAGWATLGPKLKGKLHLFAGGADTFHLNESLSLLCDFLKEKGSDATCEIIPDKTHFDLTGDPADAKSLTWRVEHEMAKAAGVQ